MIVANLIGFAIKVLVVHDFNEKVIGIFTVCDFRRAVLNEIDINENLSLLVNRGFKYLDEGFSEIL